MGHIPELPCQRWNAQFAPVGEAAPSDGRGAAIAAGSMAVGALLEYVPIRRAINASRQSAEPLDDLTVAQKVERQPFRRAVVRRVRSA